ncbi:hypothetical protein S7711_08183 [Stachybotrys chartarum IBT 7711]|uniref:Uncharacterized protein n=1 Tax=Stachybotrys chartarum (strain CBS 109288 / IBT 7711) TaxID=1280523 RepID=A0A084ANM4_STACB|nr:hypothetical protein S7711_08183 [Stachybotrys chartarum IBT 7711]KFA54680.1 hypothetical protein S40293_00669 [Stachybotrys chartarum IBT 40293]KFA80742.1 hypothetical protein S40288_05550 [Stachybotrys chartarum IBT 40288]
MHYIRLLRPPKIAGPVARPHVELLITITTDLGDSFLHPDEPIPLTVTARAPSGSAQWTLSSDGQVSWQPGMRVAKPRIALPPAVSQALAKGVDVELRIGTGERLAATGMYGILRASTSEHGLVLPASVVVSQGHADVDVLTRRIYLANGPDYMSSLFVEVEEEIGESIARHIWDAGVVALCAMADLCLTSSPALESPNHSINMPILKSTISSAESLNILELGCGVGILAIGLGTALSLTNQPQPQPRNCTILLTDLEEAETRARSNIARWAQSRSLADDEAGVRFLYENLDWEDGRQGRFGPHVESRRWDMVMLSDCTYNVDMLPALVETLSALHTCNVSAHGTARFATKVFLATKPRHDSERALFQLMADHGWATVESQVLPLPVLGAEAEAVEMYLFEKS